MKKKECQLQVVQSNDLIEATYRMDVRTKRLMLCLLAQIDARKPLPKLVYLDVNQYMEWTHTDPKTAYRDMKAGAEKLLGTIIKTYDQKTHSGEMCVLADYLRYFDDEARIECSFTTWIAPYIHFLTKNFTRLRLLEATQFRSFYTIRLFELLMQFESTGERYITIDKLRDIFQVTKKQYPLFSDFRKRVIEKSVKEINEKSSYNITWKTIKTGRRITSLSFSFEKKHQPDLFEATTGL